MKYKEFFQRNKKTVVLIIIGVILVMVLQTISEMSRSGRYITDDNGKLIAISRGNINETITLPIRIKAVKGDLTTIEELNISFIGQKEQKERAHSLGADPQEEFHIQIENLINDLGKTQEETILLPTSLDDGTKILWRKTKHTSTLTSLLLIPILLILLFESQKNKEKMVRVNKLNNVKKSLPGFNNQLLLLLNSGLIFNDALERIADGYSNKPNKEYFQEVIIQVMEESRKTNSSLIKCLDTTSKKLSIKEFSRIVNIISDNQYKGVNLTDKLEAESDILWNQRKKLAEEKGKLAETKLTFPLAMLLLVLILVTAAPAILQI